MVSMCLLHSDPMENIDMALASAFRFVGTVKRPARRDYPSATKLPHSTKLGTKALAAVAGYSISITEVTAHITAAKVAIFAVAPASSLLLLTSTLADDLSCLVSVPPFGILEPTPTYTDGRPREDCESADIGTKTT